MVPTGRRPFEGPGEPPNHSRRFFPLFRRHSKPPLSAILHPIGSMRPLRFPVVYTDFLSSDLSINKKPIISKVGNRCWKCFDQFFFCLLLFSLSFGFLIIWSFVWNEWKWRHTIDSRNNSALDGDRIRKTLRFLSSLERRFDSTDRWRFFEFIETEYRRMGFHIEIFDYDVLLSEPDYKHPDSVYVKVDNQWKVLSNGKEKPLDPEISHWELREMLVWNAYSANGSVEGPLVYANFGSEEDFRFLEKKKIQIEGRIVLIKYGNNFRAEKWERAQRRGAVGLLLFGDPKNFSPNSMLDWIGALDIGYRLNGSAIFRLSVGNRLRRFPIRNIVATLWGNEEPDRWILLTNHFDSWVRGSIDPLSGTSILLELGRLFSGQRLRRTVRFCHFDAEEFGLIGSTEWAEEMLRTLERRAVVVLNVDHLSGNMTISAKSVPSLYRVITLAASRVPQPNPTERANDRLTLLDSWRFHGNKSPLLGDRSLPSFSAPLFGSDFVPFLQFVGIAAADLRMTSAPDYSFFIYHTINETPFALENFIDTNGEVLKGMAQFWAEIVNLFSESPILPIDPIDYGIVLEETVYRMKSQLEEKNVDKYLGKKWFQNRIDNLFSAIGEFRRQSLQLKRITENFNDENNRLLDRINNRLQSLEKCFIVLDRDSHSHILYRPIWGQPLNSFPEIDEATYQWNQTLYSFHLQRIRKSIQLIQYAIESATHLLRIDDLL